MTGAAASSPGLDLKPLLDRGFDVEFRSHAAAILQIDFPDAWAELCACLLDLSIPIEEIVGSGGGEAKGTQRLRRALTDLGWVKTNFTISKAINGVQRESISHEVDHVKSFGGQNAIALEIEWNNKDPFFDRDLENYKRLHAEGAISVGVIITRGRSLQGRLGEFLERFVTDREISDFAGLRPHGIRPTERQERTVIQSMGAGMDFRRAFVRMFVSDKFGAATTHWSKLEERLHRGVGNPCPLVLIGLPAALVAF